eukprot:CAMPEP_0119050284 /NCGR_PEP_ID=MMETSP1177-20130426/68963_1 /TAXON_ID=2985 /ORGANISM="Ochromonas sp, Strain CCMP1899" /LENGTH=583 /DNA_ID=CAMNT_0007028485 /DNA_START=192 /DNA_END=1940 /DNA_ORIENTATION=+
MVKIIDKIEHAPKSQPFFSFEFFPPKTEAGIENLYLRIEKMTASQPIFVDFTWGAGGSTKDLTLAISKYTQTYLGVDVLMHLTCTSMTIESLKEILISARAAGIQNILALQGDPPKGAVSWKPIANGCNNTIDLVKLIKQEHGDYFGIAVAGFPEGHPQSKSSAENDLKFLKDKIDAGADFIMTQFFYDTDVFLSFFKECRKIGIYCPILPGMMPIQSFSSFQKMAEFCRTKVPAYVWQDLLPIKDDDEAVKAFGINLCVEMCQKLSKAGIPGFHFYTLNLQSSVLSILEEFNIKASTGKSLPWRGSRSNLHGLSEDVRPINWANRQKSYINRTTAWDEFPNGRWGDGRSPAFGELSDSHFYGPVEGSKEDRRAMWGEAPINHDDIYDVFARYVEGLIPILPWCESPLQPETSVISRLIANMNRKGFITINSQPSVNGEKSDHPLYGWGGPGGRVYQKAYIEFFVSQENLKLLIDMMKEYPNLALYDVNCEGVSRENGMTKSATALTWGVFQNKEILQPTIFDPDSFGVWGKEAFSLWTSAWASLYDDETDSSALLYDIHDTFSLVAIIDNDYIESLLMPYWT